MAKNNPADDLLKSLESKTERQMRDIFKKSTVSSTDELQLLYVNARDNAIGRYAQDLKDIARVDPASAQKYIDRANKTFGGISTIQDIIDSAYAYLDYYHVIKTEEQLRYEFERANRFVQYQDIELPIVVEFDYQFYTRSSIFQLPTFYSYVDTETITKFGKGAYHIAFPSSQAFLTDEEVSVAMKHEFGHVFLGHCTYNTTDKFEIKYSNQAMDISINLGMTKEEQSLLITLAQKIWNKADAFPCLNLANPKNQGGFGIPQLVSPTDWKGTLGWIKMYYDAEKEGGEEGGGGEGGGGGGGGGGSTQPPPPIDSTIKVGDYVQVAGSEPKVYGKVTAINDVTGEVSTTEISAEEWDNLKKGR
jgi:hypothetical protein